MPWEKTSDCDKETNCCSYALDVNERAMWPRQMFFWPGPQLVESFNEFATVFRMYGYEHCGGPLDRDGASLEPGFEKIALYMKGDEFTHVAKQRDDGACGLGPVTLPVIPVGLA